MSSGGAVIGPSETCRVTWKVHGSAGKVIFRDSRGCSVEEPPILAGVHPSRGALATQGRNRALEGRATARSIMASDSAADTTHIGRRAVAPRDFVGRTIGGPVYGERKFLSTGGSMSGASARRARPWAEFSLAAAPGPDMRGRFFRRPRTAGEKL